MKILVVGDFCSEIHEKAIFDAFKKMKHKVGKFEVQKYFHKYNLH